MHLDTTSSLQHLQEGQGGGQKVPVAAGDERPLVEVAEPVHLWVGDVPQPPGDPNGRI